jgi:hypothetical protein
MTSIPAIQGSPVKTGIFSLGHVAIGTKIYSKGELTQESQIFVAAAASNHGIKNKQLLTQEHMPHLIYSPGHLCHTIQGKKRGNYMHCLCCKHRKMHQHARQVRLPSFFNDSMSFINASFSSIGDIHQSGEQRDQNH